METEDNIKRLKIFGIFNPDSLSEDYQIRHDSFGGNIGNSLFQMAVYRSVDWTKCDVDRQITGETDIYCLVLANVFSKYFKPLVIDLTDRIIAANKKTVVIGGGIHRASEFSDSELQDVARDFANAVFSTGGSIGVRGEITFKFFCDVLGSSYGVYNIGCPSIRYFGKKIPSVKPKIDLGNNAKIAVCFTPYADSHEFTVFCDKIWREFCNSYAIMQNQYEGMLLLDGQPVPSDGIREMYPCYAQHFMMRQGRCRICPNTMNWINMLSTFDFCIGSRIHGCIASILAGIPTLLVAIDDRQIEIAKFNRIPYVRQDMINRNTSLKSLYDFAYENMDEIHKNYPSNLKIYTDFLVKNGIPVNQDFILPSFC